MPNVFLIAIRYGGKFKTVFPLTTTMEDLLFDAETLKRAPLPAKILEEGEEIFRFTGKTASSSFTLENTCKGIAPRETASEKRRKFKDAEEHGYRRAPAVLISLQEFIKKVGL